MLKMQSANYDQMIKENYKAIPCKKYELLIGHDGEGSPIIINVNEAPHLLITGDCRTGKSGMLKQITTNLVANNHDLEIYISQICKQDLIMFEQIASVKEFSRSLDKMNLMLKNIIQELNDRSQKISNMIIDFQGDNIEDYNKIYENKLKYKYLIIDDYDNLLEDYNDTREIKELKRNINSQITHIMQYGRACGVQVIMSVISHGNFTYNCPLVLALSNNKVSFRTSNEMFSRRLSGNTNASRIMGSQYFILSNNKKINGRTYNIELKDIFETLKAEHPYIATNKR
jgi:hypothetical protein